MKDIIKCQIQAKKTLLKFALKQGLPRRFKKFRRGRGINWPLLDLYFEILNRVVNQGDRRNRTIDLFAINIGQICHHATEIVVDKEVDDELDRLTPRNSPLSFVRSKSGGSAREEVDNGIKVVFPWID